jgi:hypothetical protein
MGRRCRADVGEVSLVNADYDPKTRRLASFMRARGPGDCGVIQSYAWDGTRFRLAEQTRWASAAEAPTISPPGARA